jgi:hypothetical protein
VIAQHKFSVGKNFEVENFQLIQQYLFFRKFSVCGKFSCRGMGVDLRMFSGNTMNTKR